MKKQPSEFANKVYQQLKKVPEGKVTTYKELSNSLGTKAYRAVGSALRDNPYAPKVPCHRVVATNGKIGGFKGFKAGKTINEKVEMLKAEGVVVENGKVKDFEKVIWKF